MNGLVEEKKKITTEKHDLQSMCEEYRKESESILADYNTCAQRLKAAQDEATRWSTQHQQQQQKDKTEFKRQQERISLLEESRREQEEKLGHMDQQVAYCSYSIITSL